MENSNKKILYLESLRGIAALMVAISHFRIDSHIFQNQFIGNSYLWVDFFFVLSGFVIALNYQLRINNLQSLYLFQAKRFLRLYPLHFILLIIFLCLEYVELYKEIYTNDIGIAQSFSINTSFAFWHNIFLTHSLFLDNVSWNYPSWSISAEFYTYLLFGLMMLFTRSNFRFTLYSSSILIAISFFMLLNTSMDTSQGFIRCIYSFFMGVIVFNLNSKFPIKVSPLFSYLFFLIALLGINFSGPSDAVGINILMPIIFSFLIFSLLSSKPNNKLKNFLRLKFLIFLGAISYSIYMLHAFIWRLISVILRYVFGIESSDNLAMVTNNEFLSGAILFISVIVLIIASNLSYKYIELKFNALRKHL